MIDFGSQNDSLFQRVPFTRCVDRITWIAERCRGRRVVDVGCLDETAFRVKRDGEHWLHGRIQRAASEVLGVDPSPALPDLKNEFPGTIDHIHQGYLADVPSIIEREGFRPEVIICGELIEHLPCPAELFRILSPVIAQYDCELVLTTPNPYAYQAFLMALAGWESQHVDHTALMSPKILVRACAKAGLEATELLTSHTEFVEFLERGGAAGVFLRLMDTLLFRPLQWFRPSVGGNLILVCKRAGNISSASLCPPQL